MKDKKYYITLVVISILGLFIITALWWVQDNSKVAGSCSFGGIELINVSPYPCYMDFVEEYCPVPKDVSCSFEVDGIGQLISKIFLEKIK